MNMNDSVEIVLHEQNYCWMLGKKAVRLSGSLTKGQESCSSTDCEGAHVVSLGRD